MSEKLTIQDLARGAAEKMGLTKGNAEAFVKDFFQLIADALHHDKYVKVKGLGTFKLIEVDSRASVNVNTGERIEIQGHTKVSFTPDATLRDIINRPFAHFETVPLQNEELLLSTVVEEEPAVEEAPVPLKEAPASLEEEYPPLEEELQKNALNEPQPVAEETEPQPIKEEEKDTTLAAEEPFSEEPPVREETGVAEEPVVEEVPQDKSEALSEEELAERKNTMRYFIGIVVFICLLCIGALVFIYFPGLSRALYGLKAPVEQIVDSVSQPATRLQVEEAADSVAADTLKQPAADSLRVSPSVPPTASAPAAATSAKPAVASPILPDSSSYEIVGTQESYTLQEGETLTRVALRYWGTKKLWPYIVKHNPTVIKNPDNVPYGTTIKIPKLKKK